MDNHNGQGKHWKRKKYEQGSYGWVAGSEPGTYLVTGGRVTNNTAVRAAGGEES